MNIGTYGPGGGAHWMGAGGSWFSLGAYWMQAASSLFGLEVTWCGHLVACLVGRLLGVGSW